MTIVEPSRFISFDLAETEQSIPSRFERIATRWPARLAVGFRESRWTYEALNAATDRVALAVLDALGPEPQPVALLLGQGPSLLAAILGVLRAGHFYKIDRGALPVPSSGRPQLDVPFLAPRTRLEQIVAGAWAATLDLDQVGVCDDFFDLGGDSLDAAAMLTHVSQRLGRELPAFSVFEMPTVEQLARAVETLDDGSKSPAPPSVITGPRSPLVRVQPSGSRPPFFFLHAEYGGDGFYCLNVARHVGTDQPFFGLSPFGRDGEPVPCSIEAMAAAYLTIVRREQRRGPYSLGGFCSCAVVAWEMARQLRLSGAEVALLVLIEPPATESGRVAHALHAALDFAAHLGATPEARVRFLQRATRLARLRALPKSGRTLRRLPELIRRSLRGESSAGGDRRSAIARVYSRAVEAYLPRPFDGPVLCLQASDNADDESLDEWRRLAADFTARRIPGDHDSCIIKHSRTLALTLASRLATAGGH